MCRLLCQVTQLSYPGNMDKDHNKVQKVQLVCGCVLELHMYFFPSSVIYIYHPSSLSHVSCQSPSVVMLCHSLSSEAFSNRQSTSFSRSHFGTATPVADTANRDNQGGFPLSVFKKREHLRSEIILQTACCHWKNPHQEFGTI